MLTNDLYMDEFVTSVYCQVLGLRKTLLKFIMKMKEKLCCRVRKIITVLKAMVLTL